MRYICLSLIFLLYGCSYLKHSAGIPDQVKKEVPVGEYIGVAKKLKQEPPTEPVPVKVTLLPKAEGLVDGVGILILDNNSQRFLWRTVGDNNQTWNLLFVKDNNLYSSIKDSFKFDGVIKAAEIDNRLEGRLNINYDAAPAEYYIEAFQIFKPKIIPAKNALEIKSGENFIIEVERLGDNETEVLVTIKNLVKKTELPLEIVRADKVEDSLISKVYLQIPKGTEKGEYILYITRQAQYKSNNLPFKII
jgi:hypothetical protein